MSEEFILTTKLELDDKTAKEQLEKLQESAKKEPLKLKVDVEDFETKLKTVSDLLDKLEKQMKDGIKFDKSVISDFESLAKNLKTISDSLENVKSKMKNLDSDSGTKKVASNQTELISKYKSLASALDSIQKKMKSGMSADSFQKAAEEAKQLQANMDALSTQMDETSKKKIALYDFKRSQQEIVTLVNTMKQMDDKITEIESKTKGITFRGNTSQLSTIMTEINTLKSKVTGDWHLNLDVSNDLNRLKELGTQVDNLRKVETLKESFDKIKQSIKDGLGDSAIVDLENKLNQLSQTALELDGSFEVAFNSLKSELSESETKANEFISQMKKADSLEQTNLINQYKMLNSEIEKLKSKMQNTNMSSETYTILDEKLKNLITDLNNVEQKIADVNKQKIDLSSKNDKATLEKSISNLIELDEKVTKVKSNLGNLRVTVTNQVAIDKLKTKLDEINNRKALNMDFKADMSQLEKIDTAIKNLRDVDNLSDKFDKLENSIRSAFGDVKANELRNRLNQLGTAASVLKEDFRSTFESLKAEIDSTAAKASTIEASLRKVTTQETAFIRLKEAIRTAFGDAEVNRLQTALDELRTKAQNMDATFDTSLDGFKTDLAEVGSKANTIVGQLKKFNTLQGTFNTLKEDIEKAFGTGTVNEFITKLNQVEAEARQVGGSFETMYAEANSQLRRFQSQMNRTNSTIRVSNRFWSDFSGSIRAFSLGNVLGNALTTSIYKIKDVYSDLDAAITDMKKVADIKDINTIDKLGQIQDKAEEISKSVGMSTADTIEGIASALQAGIGSMEKSMQVAKNAMMLANVGDMSQDEASKGLNTIVNSFNLEPLKEYKVQVGDTVKTTTELSDAMDKLNYASNTQAIDMQSLVQAFQGGGAVLSNYGVEIGDATAMITAANTSLQNGSRVGNGMKSIAINLQGLKTNAKEGTMELNKTAKGLREIAGIDVYSDKQKGEVKGFVELLDEVKGKWGDLKEDEQLALSEAIAGKQQATVFQALMQNYDKFMELREEFANGDQFGSAEQENERYVNSLAGKLNELKTIWTDVFTTILSGESLKSGVDVLIVISEKIQSLVNWMNKMGSTVPTILAVVSAFKSLSKVWGATTSINDAGVRTLDYTSRTHQFITNARQQNSILGGLRTSFRQAGDAAQQFMLKERLLQTASGLLQGALIGLAMYALSKLIQKLIEAKNKLKNTHDEIKSALETTQSETSSLRQNVKSLSSIAKEYDKLAGKTKLSSDELERFNELKQQVADMFPDLVSSYDENQNPILALTGSLEDYKKELQETIKEQERLTKTQENALGNAGTARANEIKNGWTYSAPKLDKMNSAISGLKSAFGESTDMKTGLDNYVKFLTERNKAADEYNKELADKNKELLEIDKEVQQEVINKLSDSFYSQNYDKLSDQAKASMQNLVNNFNWVSNPVLDETGKNKFIDAFDDISEAMKGQGNVINDWNEKIRKAQSAYQQTGDLESYKNAIKGVADELAKVTNISSEDWVIGLTPEFNGSLDADRAAFNEFLKSYGVSIQDYIDNESSSYDFTVKLKAQWDADNDLLKDLALFQGDKDASINFLIKMRDNGGFDKLTPQIKSILKGTLDDGKNVSEQELQIALSLVTKVASEGEFDATNSDILRKALNGQLTDDEIANLKVGLQLNGETVLSQDMLRQLNDWNKGKGVQWDVKVDPKVSNKEEVKKSIENQLSEFSSLNDRKEVKQLFIEGKVKGLENMKLFEEIIKLLPTNRENTIDFLVENHGDIDGMSLKEFVDWFNKQPDEFKKKYGIDVDDDGKLNVSKEKIDKVTESTEKLGKAAEETSKKDIDVKVNKGELEGSVEDYKELIKYSTKLKDGEYKISFVTDTKDALDNLDTLTKSVNNLSKAFQDMPSKTIRIETAQASKNVTGLRNNVKRYLSSVKKSPKTTFKTETAQASKNVTGLKRNISDYVKRYHKTFTTRFNAITALASKNVTGLKNNLADYVSKYAGKTFTTTLKVNRQSSGGSGSSSSGGSAYGPMSMDETTNQTPAVFSTFSNPGISLLSAPTIGDETASGISTYADTLATTSKAISKVSMKSKSTRLDLGEIGVNTTIPTKINTSVKNILDSIEYGVELFQELENRITKVNNKLTLLDTKMERAVGTKKIEYLEKQNALYEEQQKLQSELYDNLYREKEVLRENLKDYGFKFDAQGNLRAYEETMLKMERRAKELEDAAKKASDKASNYETKSSSVDSDKYDTSSKKLTKKQKEKIKEAKKQAKRQAKAESETSKKTKKSLEKQADAAQKASDEYSEKLDKVKNLTQEYLDLHNDKIFEASNEWEELNNKIAENNDEIEKLVRENKLYMYKNSITEIDTQLDILGDKYDLLSTKMQHAFGNEKLKLYNQQIDLLKQQQDKQQQLIDNYDKMIKVYKEDLGKYGFEFDSDNNITNQKDALDALQNSEDLEKVTDLMEEFIDIQTGKLPDARKEWEELGNTIKDIYDDKLDITKDIEDEITKIYKDQIEKRKDEIKKQSDAEVEAINKVKEAYENQKKTNSYEEDLKKQQDKIAEINKNIDRYSKDNSLSAKAKVSELLDDLKDEQKSLDDIINNRKDELVSDLFDKQIERIQDESEKAQTKLDEEWTDSKIADMVAQALNTGLFTSINGEVNDLQNTMLEFAESSGDAIGIMADKVKTELVGNLQAAMDIMKEYPDILNGLGLTDYGKGASLNADKLTQVTNKTLNVGDIEIKVTGTGNPTEIATEVKKQIENCFDDLISRV